MLISKLKLTTACTLGLIVTMGGLSGHAFQQGVGEPKPAGPSAETPQKERAATKAEDLIHSIKKSELELEKLEAQRKAIDQEIEVATSVIARSRRLLERLRQEPGDVKDGALERADAKTPTVPDATKESPPDVSKSPAPLSKDAAEPKDVERLLKALQSMKYAMEVKLADLRTLEEQTSRIAKKVDEFLSSGRTQPQGAVSDRSASTPKPIEVLTEGLTKAVYLDPTKPIVVPSESGHVVTVFGASNPIFERMRLMSSLRQGGQGNNEMLESQQAQYRAMTGSRGSVGGPSYAHPQPVRLAEKGDPPLHVHARIGNNLITLVFQHGKIRKLAAFNMRLGRWDVQELPEPIEQLVVPTTSENMVMYALGRRLYTYSGLAGKWSVLELPDGAAPGARANDRGLSLRYGDQLHLYNIFSGEWSRFDLKVPEEKEKASQEPK
jgi:hypothetical protein